MNDDDDDILTFLFSFPPPFIVFTYFMIGSVRDPEEIFRCRCGIYKG